MKFLFSYYFKFISVFNNITIYDCKYLFLKIFLLKLYNYK